MNHQLWALVGVILGAGLSYLGTMFTERLRWRQTKTVRWDGRRIEAYSEYAEAVKRVTRLCMRVAAFQNLGPRSDPLDVAAAQPLMSEARDARSVALEAVLLLGDDPTVVAAREWYRVAMDLYDSVVSGELTADEFLLGFHRLGAAREQFYEAARTSLQVGMGRLATRPGLDRWGPVDELTP